MRTKEKKLWKRVVAMLCILVMGMMQVPTEIPQVLAAGETERVNIIVDKATLYSNATDDTNKITLMASDITVESGKPLNYNWDITEGDDIASLETSSDSPTDNSKYVLTANSGKSGKVTIVATAFIDGTKVATSEPIEITVFGIASDFKVSVQPKSTTVGTQLVATVEGGITNASVTYEWYKGSTKINDASGSTYTPSETDSYSVKAIHPKDDSNYILETEAISNSVRVALNEVTVTEGAFSSTEITYGDTVTIDLSSSVDGSFSLNDGAKETLEETTTVTLDTSSAGEKSFTYTFTPLEESKYESVTDTITYTVKEKELTFTVSAAEKVFDGTNSIDTITVTANNQLVGSDIGTITLVLSDGRNVEETNFEFSTVGDVAQDTDVSIQVVGNPSFAIALDGVTNSNYTPTIQYGTSKITANTFEISDVATITEGDFVDGTVNWYHDTVSIKAKDDYSISTDLSGNYVDGTGTIDVSPNQDGTLSFYGKNSQGAIAILTTDATSVTYCVDQNGPTVGYTIPSSGIDFSKGSVSYKVSVSDTESGVLSNSVYYYISDDDTTKPDVDAGWTIADTVEANGTYTFTVSAPKTGYVYIKATDNVGNVKVSNEIRTLVLEEVKPTVSVTSSSTGVVKTAEFEVVAKDANEAGSVPYAYSGIYKLEYEYTVTENNGENSATNTITPADSILVENTTPTSMAEIVNLREVTDTIKVENVTGIVQVMVTATDFCGNTYTVTSDEIAVDGTAPTASVQMGGTQHTDGFFYYNADNGGVSVEFTDDYLDDGGIYQVTLTSTGQADTGEVASLVHSYDPKGTNATTNGTLTTDIQEKGKDTATITFSAEEIATLPDGTISITIHATDAAGNSTNQLLAVSEDAGASAGVVLSNLVAEFVLDTTAPIITGISTSPEEEAVLGTSYYYAEDITTSVAILDTNVGSDWKATVSLDGEIKEYGVNEGNISFVLTDDGTYSNYRISGKDKAGNSPVFQDGITLLNEDGADEATIEAGVVTLTNSKVIDQTAPTATIVYTSNVTPNVYDDGSYYRGDVTATITFDDITAADYGTLYVTQNNVDTVITSATSTFIISSEGRYTFSAGGTDLAGNTLVVESGNDTTFIVDKTAPTYTVAYDTTGATNPDLQAQGNRYYLNNGYEATVVVDDTNMDDKLLFVERGSSTLSPGVDSTTATLDFNSVTSLPVSNGEVVDQVSDDGLYSYRIYGTDKAGNELVSGAYTPYNQVQMTYDDIINKDMTADLSHYIIIDTIAPTGTMCVSEDVEADYDDASFYYVMSSDGTVSVADPYRNEDKAKIFMVVDQSEISPVNISYKIGSIYAGKTTKQYVSNEDTRFTYAKMVSAIVSKEQIFTVEDFVITDLAGNTSTTDFMSNKIYLDVSAPNCDELQPTISMAAQATSNGNGSKGQPLFNTSVPMQVTISDPYADTTSTGLGDVTWDLLVNGAVVSSGVLNAKKDVIEEDEFVYKVNQTITFSSSEYNYNDLEMKVTAYDNAGNETVKSYMFGIDTTKPIIHVTYDNNAVANEKYFKEARTATVVVTERNFDMAKMAVTTSGQIGSWNHSAGSSSNGDDDTWSTQIVYAVDGEYDLSISGKDLLGNIAESVTYDGVATNHFVIDTTTPVVAVAYNTSAASNDIYYNVDRIATIEVTDTNFVGTNDIIVNATEGGVAPDVIFRGSTSTLSFTGDGHYAFNGTVTDLAGNISTLIEEPEFVIDQTLPEISFSGVEDLSANRSPLDIILSMTDTNINLESISATLIGTYNGTIDISGNATYIEGGIQYVLDTIEKDDYYLLNFVATDLAGNSESHSISFSENQRGTEFEFVQEEVRNTYTNESFAPAFILHNVDEVTVLSLTVNGEEVAYDYVGDTVTLANALTAEGMYKITMDTVDAAGNQNTMDTVEFYIDYTAPKLSIDGVEDGQYYFETFTFNLRQDNMADHYLLLQLNGKDLEEGDYILNEDGSISITVASFDTYELVAQLIDAAGNTSEKFELSFILTNNIFVRWYSNKAMFFGSLAVLTVIGSSFVVIGVKKKIKKV